MKGVTKRRASGPKKIKAKKLLFALYHNWAGDWSGSIKFAFHAASLEDAKAKADDWARKQGFSTKDVGVGEITGVAGMGIQIRDEFVYGK